MRAFLAALFLLLSASAATAGPASLFGVMPALVWKAQEIIRVCGSIPISGFRRGARVAGSGRMSLHASGHAIDMRGNPACIFGQLRGWPGGYSTDYRAVAHVHISLGGREDGLRFTHRHHARRYGYASRHRHGRHYRRYARA